MTEKELYDLCLKEKAEDVWELLDKQLLSASRTFDVARTVYQKGSRDYLATTMDELEKILPRPKRKVKKTETVYLLVDYVGGRVKVDKRVFFSCGHAEVNKTVSDIIREIEISMEVEE